MQVYNHKIGVSYAKDADVVIVAFPRNYIVINTKALRIIYEGDSIRNYHIRPEWSISDEWFHNYDEERL